MFFVLQSSGAQRLFDHPIFAVTWPVYELYITLIKVMMF
jgi:hypothetical protein